MVLWPRVTRRRVCAIVGKSRNHKAVSRMCDDASPSLYATREDRPCDEPDTLPDARTRYGFTNYDVCSVKSVRN